MKKLTASAAKKALASTDPVVLGHAIRRLVRDDAYDSESLYRVALASDPKLSRAAWDHRYIDALRAVSPFGKLERGDRIRAGKNTYVVDVVDIRAGVVDLSTGRAKPGSRSLITLMESGIDEGKFVVASPRTATTIDSFQKL